MATIGRSVVLGDLIDAALADPACLELLVIVDGPSIAAAAQLRGLAADRPALRVLTGPRRGQLGALDEAVRQARGDVVVLLDDDVIPSSGLISGHLRRHAAKSGLVVVGPMPVKFAASGVNVATRLYAVEYAGHLAAIASGEVRVLDALWTGNVSMRRVDCLRVGLASSAFSVHYHADRELGYRLDDAGLVGYFDPALIATHMHTRSDAAFLTDAIKAGAGRAALHQTQAERLGPFAPENLVADLPAPLQRFVRTFGRSPLASPVASTLMLVGRTLTKLRSPDAGLAAAKLARRVMQYRGAAAISSTKASK